MREAESDKETTDFFRHSNEASSASESVDDDAGGNASIPRMGKVGCHACEEESTGRRRGANKERTAALRGSHPAQESGALDHTVESSFGREDAGQRRTALPGGSDGDPGAADSSSESSASTTDGDDDDVPLPRAEFRALKRRTSRMTIGDIEAGEVAAWISVLDVMECLSSDDDDDKHDQNDDDDEARVELRTTSPEVPRRAPRTSFRRATAAIIG